MPAPSAESQHPEEWPASTYGHLRGVSLKTFFFKNDKPYQEHMKGCLLLYDIGLKYIYGLLRFFFKYPDVGYIQSNTLRPT